MKRIFICALVLAAVALPAVGITVLDGDTSPVGVATADDCEVPNYRDAAGDYGTPDALINTDGLWFQKADSQWDCDDYKEDLDYYGAAGSMRAGWQQFENTYSNSLQNTVLVAWSEMEKATLWEYDNGTSLTAAKSAVDTSYGNYYTTKQLNLLQNWRAIVQASDTWENQSNYEMFDVSAILQKSEFQDGGTWYTMPANNAELDSYGVDYVGKGPSTNITLANGTNATVPTIQVEMWGTYYDPIDPSATHTITHTVNIHPYMDDYTFTRTSDVSGTNIWNEEEKIRHTIEASNLKLLSPPDGDGQTQSTWLMFDTFTETLNKTNQEHDNFADGSDSYVQAIYDGLNSGQINYTDAISRATKADQYLSQATGENSSFSVYMAGLAVTGYNGYDPVNTSYMTVEFDAERYGNQTNPITRDGAILSRYAPDGGWVYNTTYNTSNLTGAQMFVSLDGDEYDINGTFRILTAKDRNGDTLDASDIDQPGEDRFEVQNSSSYVEWMQHMENRTQALEEALNDGSGGGIGDPDLSIPDPFDWLAGIGAGIMRILAIVAVVVVALLLLAVAS